MPESNYKQDHAQPNKRSILNRLILAIISEFENLNLRLVLANFAVLLLPDLCFSRLRTAIYRTAGFKIGSRTLLIGRVHFTGSGLIQKRLTIGSGCIVNAHTYLDLTGCITIQDNVSIGHHVVLITTDHEIGPAVARTGPVKTGNILIESGTWIAACTTVLPGVSIGKGSVVAAGSVVSGSVPENRMVGGVPARALKALE